MNKNNIMIIAIVGVLAIGAAYYFSFLRNPVATTPGSFQQPPPSSKFLDRVAEYSKKIEGGEAAAVLPDIEQKIAAYENSEGVDMEFFLHELRGDAQVKLGNCDEAVKSYGVAIELLGKVSMKKSVGEAGMITQNDVPKFTDRINAKVATAKQCPKK